MRPCPFPRHNRGLQRHRAVRIRALQVRIHDFALKFLQGHT
ncbi:hypothetical protein [Alicycliphilus denitrificans]